MQRNWPDHVIFREDHAYIYPYPNVQATFLAVPESEDHSKSFSYLTKRENGYQTTRLGFPNQEQQHDAISLSYSLSGQSTGQKVETPQFNTTKEPSFLHESRRKCSLTLKSNFSQVPWYLFTRTYEVPRRSIDPSETSFRFTGFYDAMNRPDGLPESLYRTWQYDSQSWVSSTIYHINCSKLRTTSDSSPSPLVNETLQHCADFAQDARLSFTGNLCLVPTQPESYVNRPFVLNLQFSSSKNSRFPLGSLEKYSTHDRICKTDTVDLHPWQKRCVQYTVKAEMGTHRFDRNNLFSVGLYSFRFLQIKLLLPQQHDLNISWLQMNEASDHNEANQFKVFHFFVQKSWISAWNACREERMGLPSFRSHKDLLRAVALSQSNMLPTPLHVFVAIYQKVDLRA